MNDAGWQVGDLALCLVDAWNGPSRHHPRIGEILTVSRVTTDPAGNLMLLFDDRPQNMDWYAPAFRKIRPHELAAAQAAAANLFSKLSLERQQACLRELKGKFA